MGAEGHRAGFVTYQGWCGHRQSTWRARNGVELSRQRRRAVPPFGWRGHTSRAIARGVLSLAGKKEGKSDAERLEAMESLLEERDGKVAKVEHYGRHEDRKRREREEPDDNDDEEDKSESMRELSAEDVQDIIKHVEKECPGILDLRLQVGSTVIQLTRPGGYGYDHKGRHLRPAAPVGVDTATVSTNSAAPPPAMDESMAPADENVQVAINNDRPSYDDRTHVLDTDFRVTSDRVGYFYTGPPSKAPYVRVGDRVEPRRPLCVVKQLGHFFVYHSEVSGTVIRVCAENGAPVEFGQELMVVRPE